MKNRVLKPFDLEKAKNGAEICTRSGRPAIVICWDIKNNFPIVAIVTLDDGSEVVLFYTNEGKFLLNEIDDNDLMLVEYEEEQHQFKPFDKVICRSGDDEFWTCDLFSHKEADLFLCIGGFYAQCIPFEGNEYIIGTTYNHE